MDHEIYLWLLQIEEKLTFIYDKLREKGIIPPEEKKEEKQDGS